MTAINNLFVRPKFHNPVVDGVRAVGIILVIIAHLFYFHSPFFTLNDKTLEIYSFGSFFRPDLALEMFFVISGFLIGSILFSEHKKTSRISFRSFYLKRFFRLMPVYVVSIILGVLFYLSLKNSNPEFHSQINTQISNLWTNFLYVNNFVSVENQFMAWTWSLAVEEQFYFIVPLFILFLLRKVRHRVYLFFFLLILSSVIRFFIVYKYNLQMISGGLEIADDKWRQSFNLLYDNLYTRYGGLLIGVFGSYLSVFYKKRVSVFFKSFVSTFFYYLCLFILVSIFFKLDYFYFIRFGPDGSEMIVENLSFYEKVYYCFVVSTSRNIFAFCVMYVVFYLMFSRFSEKNFLYKFLSSKSLFTVSQLSYASYLIHPLIIIPVCRYLTSPLYEFFGNMFVAFFINSVICLIFIFLFSSFLYVFVERPFMDFRKSLFFKKLSGSS